MPEVRMTRQGVRDLNDPVRRQPKPTYPAPFMGDFESCDHRNMQMCCPECCGHYFCPDCGLAWDDYAGM